MAHVLLPSISLARDITNRAKFPETARAAAHRAPEGAGRRPAAPRRETAGGASMFSQLVTTGTIQMGERNVLAARSALRAAAIPIVRESVGGERGAQRAVLHQRRPRGDPVSGRQ